jgi:helicase
MLEDWKFIVRKREKIIPTRIGKRVSELYIDPLTAHNFIEILSTAIKRNEIEPFSFLHTISNTIEMRPLLSVRSNEFSEIETLLLEREKSILQETPEEYDLEFEDFFKSFKTALMFENWIDEATEDQILTKFRVAPGELRGRLKIADWLVYSLQELALLLGYKDILREIRKLKIRLQYGIKEELISLVRLRDVGRMRSRILYRTGLTSIQKLREIPYDRLSLIVGPKTAKSIKDQLEGKKELKKEEKQTILKI